MERIGAIAGDDSMAVWAIPESARQLTLVSEQPRMRNSRSPLLLLMCEYWATGAVGVYSRRSILSRQTHWAWSSTVHRSAWRSALRNATGVLGILQTFEMEC